MILHTALPFSAQKQIRRRASAFKSNIRLLSASNQLGRIEGRHTRFSTQIIVVATVCALRAIKQRPLSTARRRFQALEYVGVAMNRPPGRSKGAYSTEGMIDTNYTSQHLHKRTGQISAFKSPTDEKRSLSLQNESNRHHVYLNLQISSSSPGQSILRNLAVSFKHRSRSTRILLPLIFRTSKSCSVPFACIPSPTMSIRMPTLTCICECSLTS